MSALQDSALNRDRGRGAGREQLGRIGLWTGSLEGLTPAGIPEVLGELDEQGWGSLWSGEAVGREAFTAAQLYLGATRRMAIGTGIAAGRAPPRPPLRPAAVGDARVPRRARPDAAHGGG
ncbi:hypothetical protein [Dietzia cinnamea]|uniref:hypothetical protein n=1 Tax=Dietzia cinnamea TaxID=321318 RepID=UPI00223C446B|nr:hypothetical protein [Dietzia cinnamea]MCT2063093.1 hypothetical protein [Dietzia cinnamea]MCT2236864.1 hypothetical protein [Dietzia cinnamea]MCT2302118.1 hypothetical protein [Dietzia cinnamea]